MAPTARNAAVAYPIPLRSPRRDRPRWSQVRPCRRARTISTIATAGLRISPARGGPNLSSTLTATRTASTAAMVRAKRRLPRMPRVPRCAGGGGAASEETAGAGGKAGADGGMVRPDYGAGATAAPGGSAPAAHFAMSWAVLASAKTRLRLRSTRAVDQCHQAVGVAGVPPGRRRDRGPRRGELPAVAVAVPERRFVGERQVGGHLPEGHEGVPPHRGQHV